jgi:hypothetical protein
MMEGVLAEPRRSYLSNWNRSRVSETKQYYYITQTERMMGLSNGRLD